MARRRVQYGTTTSARALLIMYQQQASDALQVLKDAGIVRDCDLVGTPFQMVRTIDVRFSCMFLIATWHPTAKCLIVENNPLLYRADMDRWSPHGVDDTYQSILQKQWKQHVLSIVCTSTPLGAERGLGRLIAEFSVKQRRHEVPFFHLGRNTDG